jgi:uncharacterized protein
MNVMVPIRRVFPDPAPNPALAPSLGSEREIWAERRRMMERRRRDVGPDGSRPHWRSALFGRGVHVFGAIARLCGLYGLGRGNALAPRLIELDFSFPDLPRAFDGYRILHLSDTHFDFLPELAERAADMLSGIDVDLLALTGDIHGHHRAPLGDSVAPLATMLDGLRVRDGHIGVLGNHDPAEMAEALERLGFAVLINDSITLNRAGQKLVVTGLDDVHRFYTAAADRALADAPPGFRIALVHSAEMADRAETAAYSLYLCGHTHGGQLCLPNGRPIFTRLRRCRFGARGEWRWGRMIGYTSHGLGISGVPLRYNCPGEMTVITLRRRGAEG